jgi:hypothetical protein
METQYTGLRCAIVTIEYIIVPKNVVADAIPRILVPNDPLENYKGRAGGHTVKTLSSW